LNWLEIPIKAITFSDFLTSKVVFDELDQRLAFLERPEDVQLPEFDSFRNQAIEAENAYPPSGETLTAMPALITGSLVEKADLAGPQDLRLKLADKRDVIWRSMDNVFTEAQAEGFTTALVGWYHPYCRMFASALNVCAWEPLIVEASPTAERMTLFETMVLWDRLALFNVPFVFRLLWKSEDKEIEQKRHHAEEYGRLSSFALRTIPTDLNLIVVHYPIPHLPGL